MVERIVPPREALVEKWIDRLAAEMFPFQESEFEQESFTDVGRQRVGKVLDELIRDVRRQAALAALPDATQEQDEECPVCGVKRSEAADVAAEIAQEHVPTAEREAEGRQIMARLGQRLIERAAAPADAGGRPQTAWQPIESYDKAIHPLDVLVATTCGVGEARQLAAGWFWANTCDDGAPGPGETHPTHWMPLPDPPQESPR